MRHRLLLLAALSVGAAIGAAPAHATITQVSSRGALGGTTTADWSLYGPAGTGLSTPSFVAVGSQTIGVASSSGQLYIYQQGADWDGNFGSGDYVLFQPNDSDNTIVSFATPVAGIGTQIQADAYGPFTGYMDLFSVTNVLLAEISVSGDSNGLGDNSAVFIGATSSAADISYAIFSVDIGNPLFPKQGDLGINQLDFTSSTAVPEPGSLLLIGGALGLLGLVRRRSA